MKKILLILPFFTIAFASCSDDDKYCWWCTVRDMINLNILKAGNNCYYTNDEFNSVEDSIKNANKTITIFIGTDSAELVGNSNVVSIFGDSAIVLTNVTCIKQDHMKEY